MCLILQLFFFAGLDPELTEGFFFNLKFYLLIVCAGASTCSKSSLLLVSPDNRVLKLVFIQILKKLVLYFSDVFGG